MTFHTRFRGTATAALAIVVLAIASAARGQSGENPSAAQNWIARDLNAGLTGGIGSETPGGGLGVVALGAPEEGANPVSDLSEALGPTEPGASPARGWQLIVTPYGWVPMMDGDATIGKVEAPVDISIDDLIDAAKYIDYGGSFLGELRRNGWGLFGELLFYKLSAKSDADIELERLRNFSIRDILERRGIGENLPGLLPEFGFDPMIDLGLDPKLEIKSKFDFTQLLAELGIARRVWDGPVRFAGHDFLAAVDVIGGARYWYFHSEVEADAKLTVGERSRSKHVSVEATVDWVDPFIGARTFLRLADRLDLLLRADVGGFGAGSDFTWKAAALLNFQVTDRFSLYGGYQGLGVDYEEGSGRDRFELDIVMHGPIVGFAYRFGGPKARWGDVEDEEETPLPKG